MIIQPSAQAAYSAPQSACGKAPDRGSDEVRLGEREPVAEARLGTLAGNRSPELFKLLDKAIQAVKAAPLSELDKENLDRLSHSIPKVDLHRHLEGSIEPEVLIPIAQKYGIELPSYDVETLRPHIQITPEDHGLLDFLKKFDVIGKVFHNKEVISDITTGVIGDACKDNVKYLEIRYSPQYMAKAHNLPLEDVVLGVFEGVQKAADQYDTKVTLTLIVERWDSHERAQEVADLAARHQDKGVVALDLANDEVNFPPGPFQKIFQDAKKAGLKITVHAGEAGAADNVRVSIEKLGADRVGHGVNTEFDPEGMQLVHDKHVTLEMCPTSNEQTDSIDSFANHPIRRYYDAGEAVTINTDDPAVSGITLSGDVARTANQFGFSLNDLRKIEQNAIDAAFTDDQTRRELTQSFDQGFEKAAQELVGSLTLSQIEQLALKGAGDDSHREQIRREIETVKSWLVSD